MKRFKYILAAVFAACTLSLVSCSGSKTDQFIDDYQKLCNKTIEAVESGDVSKAMELQKEADALQEKYSDLKEEDFTPEQRKRVEELTTKMTNSIMGNADKFIEKAKAAGDINLEMPSTDEQ